MPSTYRDATLSCLSLQQSRPDTAAPSEPTAAIGAAAGAGAGVIAAAKVLWSTMVQAGLPFCYKSGPVLSSALLFMFTVGDSRSDSSQMSPVGEGTQGSMDGVGRDLGPMHGLQDRDSGSTSLGIQVADYDTLK